MSLKRIKGFDGLRGLSALLVFWEHKVASSGVGSIGVFAFFCLSGYLIIGILHRARLGIERDDDADKHWRALFHFWRNRAVRIFPIYYATLFLVIVAGRMHWPESAFYLTYLQNFYIAFVTRTWGVITHFWTLAIEQQFYVLAAPALIWLSASRHRALMQWVLWFCIIFTLAAPLAGWDYMKVSLSPMSKFAFMAVGGYITLTNGRSRVCQLLAQPVTLVFGTLLVAAALVLLAIQGENGDGANTFFNLAGLFFAGSLICLVVERQNCGFVRFLELRPLRWLGEISYGFYVYHYLVPDREKVLARVHSPLLANMPSVVWVLLQLACTLLISYVSWVYFERRFLALKSGKDRAPELVSAR